MVFNINNHADTPPLNVVLSNFGGKFMPGCTIKHVGLSQWFIVTDLYHTSNTVYAILTTAELTAACTSIHCKCMCTGLPFSVILH